MKTTSERLLVHPVAFIHYQVIQHRTNVVPAIVSKLFSHKIIFIAQWRGVESIYFTL